MSSRDKVLVELERKEATALGAFVDSFIKLSADDPALDEARPYLARAKGALAAALDSNQHEQFEEHWRVVELFDGGTKVVHLGRTANPDYARYVFEGLHRDLREPHGDIRTQSRTTVISPWVDLDETGEGS